MTPYYERDGVSDRGLEVGYLNDLTEKEDHMNETTRYTADALKEILRLHADWLKGVEGGKRADLSGAYLRSANLRSANLSGADLSGAYLRSADLRSADLSGAYLRIADLRSADLRSADLSGANLSDANLRSANLRSADLRSADLSDDTTLSTGETWRAYLDTVLPQLYVAGGKSLAEVAAAWECHSWDNCPMAVAFGINGTADLSGLPLLLKPRIEQFVQLFDAKLIPKPVVAEEAAS